MIIKITENNLTVLEQAMVKSLAFADYNSECFSCSDISKAQDVCKDLTRIFEIFKDNNINVLKCFSSDSIKQLSDFYDASTYNNADIDKNFEVLMPISCIWRFSTELIKQKYSDDSFVKIENDYFCKYWTDITLNSLYDIKPTMEALNAFANVNGKLNNALDLITSELNNCNITRIRAIDCGSDGMELEISYLRDHVERVLCMYEDAYRADIVITENKLPVKIYPLESANKMSVFFENDEFVNRYKELTLEDARLNNLSKQIFSEKLSEIKANIDNYDNSHDKSLDADIYNFVQMENKIKGLKEYVTKLESDDMVFFEECKKNEHVDITHYFSDYTDEELKDLFICTAHEDIYYTLENLDNEKYDILSDIYNSISTEDFKHDLDEICKQNHYAISKNVAFSCNSLKKDFAYAEQYCNIQFN